ncbi:MAG: filamentous hemagglutinin N-terminal domain-containing protein [Tolypothrix brevis GSE-NOS-MK-07-07A]|jgi:filamentous hemagglutinin family protein|nr:filamentous hemagglutinin N-terminal domain-containing protein [Tolypothrix brevis GSE-NOS-MK-07-07A]
MFQNKNSCFWQLGLAIYFAISGAIASGFADSAFAQSLIIPDSTLGNESSRVVPNEFGGSTEVLMGGATRGNNLFHSFLELNVSEGRAAFFLNSSNIQNIITRVTGRNRSEILGPLGTFQMIDGNLAFSNANLFLINPNGIVFGPNAALNLGGSFVGSTASSIKFADGTEFSATASPTTPLLTVSVPIGLQFGTTPRDIQVQGGIAVEPGKTLALIGGNVTLDGGLLTAPLGQIVLGGILGEGTIGLNLDSNNLPFIFPNNVSLGDISLSRHALVGISEEGEGSGNIQVQGNRVTLANGSGLVAQNLGSQNGKGISIQAEQLTIKDGSQVSTSTFGAGSGGSLTVNASESVQVTGTDADGLPSALFTQTRGTGAAGNLTINTGKLIVEDGANIAASAFEGSQGSGGTLNVTASDLVKLSGTSMINGMSSGLFTQTLSSGDAGSLTINTGKLIVEDGAQVTAGTGINSTGKGGNLTVRASDSVEISGTAPNSQSGSGLVARTRGTGDAGSLMITTPRLIVKDGAQVTVEGLGSGNAGNLQIQAGSIRLDTTGKLTAQTTSGRGGDISIKDTDLLLLRRNSQITTNADTSQLGADVAGGNINIDSKLIVALPEENSDITANAFRGRGGNINITTQGIFGIQPRQVQTPESDITASSQLGVNGMIQINTPDIDPSRGILRLPAEVFNASRQIAQSCGDRNAGKTNEFIVTGRGGLPLSPDDFLSSDVVWSDTRLITTGQKPSSKTTATISSRPDPVEIIPATGWVFNDQGEVTLTADAPNGLRPNFIMHCPKPL